LGIFIQKAGLQLLFGNSYLKSRSVIAFILISLRIHTPALISFARRDSRGGGGADRRGGGRDDRARPY